MAMLNNQRVYMIINGGLSSEQRLITRGYS
jgi:hypothetical protein